MNEYAEYFLNKNNHTNRHCIAKQQQKPRSISKIQFKKSTALLQFKSRIFL